MAFDHNLEADRIDGFNLFSVFVRVPLLVLGGILGGNGSSGSDEVDSDSLRDHHGRNIENDTDNNNNNNNSDRQFHNNSDCTKRLKQRRQPSNTTSIAHSIQRKSSEYITDRCHNSSGMKRTKKMSWSDESGLPLVYENEEVRREENILTTVLNIISVSIFYSTACTVLVPHSMRSVSCFASIRREYGTVLRLHCKSEVPAPLQG